MMRLGDLLDSTWCHRQKLLGQTAEEGHNATFTPRADSSTIKKRQVADSYRYNFRLAETRYVSRYIDLDR